MFGISTLGVRSWVSIGVILVVAVIAVVVGVVLARKKQAKQRKAERRPRSGSAGSSWKSYLKLQGIVVCVFLFFGASIGWLSAFLGPVKGQITNGVKLIEYRNLDLSQHPVYKDLDTENYSGITIITKTIAPENGAANLMIYGGDDGLGKDGVRRVESVANSWSQWKQENPSKHISLSIRGAEQTGVTPAAQADILVYLTPR